LEGNFYGEVRLPPLGIAYIAGVLRREGHEIEILDENAHDRPEGLLESALKKDFEVVGFSATSASFPRAARLSRLVKEMSPDSKVILGGIHATIFPREILEANGSIDYIVAGEGEETCMELVRRIQDCAAPSDVSGVAYRKDGGALENPRRPLIENLDDLPFPAYDLLPLRRYESVQIEKTPFTSMITSRGCPFGCTFCGAFRMFGRRFRFHSPERTFSEVRHLVENHKIREIMFKDSEFLIDKGRVEKFCDLLLEGSLDLAWSCNARADNVTESLLSRMRRAGCHLIKFGVESGDDSVLRRMKKGMTTNQVREAVKTAKRAGIRTEASFMIGNAGDSRKTIEKTIEFALELDTDFVNFGLAVPLPDTELYETARKSGWLMPGFDPHGIKFGKCYMNATDLSSEELVRFVGEGYRRFYLRPGYVMKRTLTANRIVWRENLKGLSRILRILSKR